MKVLKLFDMRRVPGCIVMVRTTELNVLSRSEPVPLVWLPAAILSSCHAPPSTHTTCTVCQNMPHQLHRRHCVFLLLAHPHKWIFAWGADARFRQSSDTIISWFCIVIDKYSLEILQQTKDLSKPFLSSILYICKYCMFVKCLWSKAVLPIYQ